LLVQRRARLLQERGGFLHALLHREGPFWEVHLELVVHRHRAARVGVEVESSLIR
jgi:hypothetical protein